MSATAKPERAQERICIAGGTGFVGGFLRAAFTNRPLRLLVRDPLAAAHLASSTVEIRGGDVTNADSLRGALDGCHTAINLVAMIAERDGETFDRNIRQGTEYLVREAERANVGHFVLMSAMGARDDARYPYLQAKWNAERVVQRGGVPWTIVRPSVIFGPGDEFINTLARLARRAPVLPIAGDGQGKFQPVAAIDVAAAFRRIVDDPTQRGNMLELGGPEVLAYEQMLDIVCAKLGVSRPKVHVPMPVMRALVKLTSPLPRALRPPVTAAQLSMLAIDNCTNDSATEWLIEHPPLRLADGIDYIR